MFESLRPDQNSKKSSHLAVIGFFMGDCFCQFLFLPHFLPHPKVHGFTKQAARQLLLIGEVLIVAC
jgi:hypothetical protein